MPTAQDSTAYVKTREIPPTEVGGLFRSSLQQTRLLKLRNPTHGSGWILQIQPTNRQGSRHEESHPREWVDSSDPTYNHIAVETENPTHGSGWIVQIQPCIAKRSRLILPPCTSVSIEECALLLMNNAQHFIGKNYPQRLVEAGINQLWEASAYAGTSGEFTTALIKAWLSTSEQLGLSGA